MDELIDALRELAAQQGGVTDILDAYAKINYIHRESLKAMGLLQEVALGSQSTGGITFSADPSLSDAAIRLTKH